MSEEIKGTRLSKAAREFNVGITTIVEFLSKKGIKIDGKPNTKISPDVYKILLDEYQSEKEVKEESKKIGLNYRDHRTISIEDQKKIDKEPDEYEDEDEQEELFIKNVAGDFNAETIVSDKKETEKDKTKENKTEQKEKPKEKTEKEEDKESKKELVSTQKKEDSEKEKDEQQQKQTKQEEVVETEKTQKETEKEKPVADVSEKKKKETTVDAEKEKSDKNEKEPETRETKEPESEKDVRILGKIDLDSLNLKTRPTKKSKEEKKKELEDKKKAGKELLNINKKKDRKEKTETKKEEAVATKKETDKKPELKEQPKTKKEESDEEVKEVPKKEKPVEKPAEKPKAEEKKDKEDKNFIPTKVEKLSGPKILDKIDLPSSKKTGKKPVVKKQDRRGGRKDDKKEKQPVASSKDESITPKKKKRRRITKPTDSNQQQNRQNQQQRQKRDSNKTRRKKTKEVKQELSDEEIQKQIKETLSKLNPSGKSKAVKHRRQKRATISKAKEEELKKQKEEQTTLKVTEFVTVNELATMMDVPVNEIISTCMSLGLFVSINQRLDAETLTIVAEEFGFKVEFVSVEVQEAIGEHEEIENGDDDLTERPPIVTVMGHVDHGKTKLLDYVRKTNVVAGEAGGITQHIGAYEVTLPNEKRIVFLDTPGHEAFTAMRARGAKITDVAIIVIAADDNVMPQTREAINHAQAANVPIVFAINKVDKPNANPDKIKEELSKMNILVEEWGGKYQSQDISAKQGIGIDELLEKVLLESELLELKGNPDKLAMGTVLESSLDKGRGYIAKLLVQNGSLSIGDMVVAGSHFGKVKAMFNERNQHIKTAGPSTPVLLLGLNGAPQAGDGFNVMKDEREAKEIATKRLQLQREQGIRTQKHITLDEIGRRIAIGDFKELNIIVKGDVDGSVEALSDSLLKQATNEVQVNVILKAVGAITETDINLASASNAIIIGFQVRPTPGARKLAETEQIDIRLYSIIYQAIEEIKAAIEGMLAPEIEEKITCNVEVRNTFKISKVGTVAGCMVLDGKITRNTRIRLIRDGIVVYTGVLGSLKRFKDDVKEVNTGYECGLNIEKFNDIKVGDIIEGYEEIEVKRKL